MSYPPFTEFARRVLRNGEVGTLVTALFEHCVSEGWSPVDLYNTLITATLDASDVSARPPEPGMPGNSGMTPPPAPPGKPYVGPYGGAKPPNFTE